MKVKIINIIALSVLSAAVIGLIAYSSATGAQLREYRSGELLSRESVFEGLVSSVEDLDGELEKLSVSNDPDQFCALLSGIWKNTAEIAAQVDLTPLAQEDKLELESFVNVTGDYAHTLERRLRQGETLSAEERDQLERIGGTVHYVADWLKYARENGYSADMDLDDYFEERGIEFAAEYPQVEYDGFFSEKTRNRTPAGLAGYSVTEQKALKIAETFAECDLIPVAHTDGEPMSFYNFENEQGNIRVSVTKQGGGVLYYKNHISTDGLSAEPTAAKLYRLEEAAEDFLEKHSFEDCEVGRKQYYNGMAVLEMIPVAEDVLLYPDTIRLWVDVQTETVMGMDAGNYLMNHRERDFPREILSEEDAREKLSEKLTVRDSRLAVISKEDGSEQYCRVFSCSTEQQDFLVFLDAATGKEAEIRIAEKYGNGQFTMQMY